MHRYRARRMVIVGIPPLGCAPLIRTLMGTTSCYEDYNKLSFSFNSKIRTRLDELRTALWIKTAFLGADTMTLDAINNPQRYGETETSKGCCGSGTVEYGDSCKRLTTCPNPNKYVFWDTVHLTQKMYWVIADEAIALLNHYILN